ncbi:MAG: Uncharacterised protein [Candidatus Poseidoniaceae archaeon]|nr:MAG: Uncharacterised protein [Candidatus Poseidoniaceae archaeon]
MTTYPSGSFGDGKMSPSCQNMVGFDAEDVVMSVKVASRIFVALSPTI